MAKIDSKVASYESFIEDTLKKDLRAVEALLKDKDGEYTQWQELKNCMRHMKARKEEELTTSFEVGSGVYMLAKVEERDKVIVSVGCGYFLEMYYEEADKYVDIKLKYLRQEMDFLRQQGAHIKAHIKLVLLAIAELQNVR